MRVERVFIDTNVLLSGLAFRGNEARLLQRALDRKMRLVIAEKVLVEARTTGLRKFPWIVTSLEDLLRDADCELFARPPERLVRRASTLVRDPDDAEILASILLSEPDVALTGDKDLLTDEVRAVAPTRRCAEYLERLEREE